MRFLSQIIKGGVSGRVVASVHVDGYNGRYNTMERKLIGRIGPAL